MNALIVFIGGGIGAVLRFGITRLFGSFSVVFPWATFASNLLACLLAGLALGLFKDKLSDTQFLFVLTGVCGGLSTFSTFTKENLELLDKQQYIWFSVNIFSSIIGCLVLLWLMRKMG